MSPAKHPLYRYELAGNSYKKAGVMVSGIVPQAACSTTLSLFAEKAPAAQDRDGRIMLVMDAINQPYGSGAVHLAAAFTFSR